MLTNNNRNFLNGIKNNIEEEKKKDREEINTDIENTSMQNTFEQGLSITRQIMSGNKIKTPRLLVETTQCKIWDRHNRSYERLNEVTCKDLIEQFKETGKQEFPAIVRLIEGNGDIKYEIICGARRFWTSQYLKWKYFIEIRELTDEEAFRLSDIENRAREDISDYERAIDYKNALTYYYMNQVQMAEKLEVSPSWLSRYLDLADLPKEIVNAYRDISEIKIIHARKLKQFLTDTLSNKVNKEQIINKAIEIKPLNYNGSKIIAELLSVVVKPKTKRNRFKNHHSSQNGLVNMQISKRNDKKIEILIDKQETASKEDFHELFNKIIEHIFLI